MILNTKMKLKQYSLETSKCIVERVIEMPSDEYKSLCHDPAWGCDKVEANSDAMYIDEDKTFHCLLILDENGNDGILASDNGYMVDTANIPNARQLVMLDKYPSLEEYVKRMAAVAEDVVLKAKEKLAEGHREYEIDIEDYYEYGVPNINLALLENMLCDIGAIDDSRLHSDCLVISLNDDQSENDCCDEAEQNDLTM